MGSFTLTLKKTTACGANDARSIQACRCTDSDVWIRSVEICVICGLVYFFPQRPAHQFSNRIARGFAVVKHRIDFVCDRHLETCAIREFLTARAVLIPSATSFNSAVISASVLPFPSSSPTNRLRERLPVHVNTRSPSPASPINVSTCAPSRRARRVISASPRVISAATLFEPKPSPDCHPSSDRHHVLHRATQFGSDDVGVRVNP